MWEHRVIEVMHTGAGAIRIQEEMHKMEVLGWELVSASVVKDYYSYHYLYFKRPAEE